MRVGLSTLTPLGGVENLHVPGYDRSAHLYARPSYACGYHIDARLYGRRRRRRRRRDEEIPNPTYSRTHNDISVCIGTVPAEAEYLPL